MKKLIAALLFTSVIVQPFLFTGCTKPENMLIGTWQMESYFINGIQEPDEIKVSWKFLEDGTFRQKISYPNREESEKGDWTLNSKSNVLTMKYMDRSTRVDWRVIKLEKDFLEVNYRIEGFFVEREFQKIKE